MIQCDECGERSASTRRYELRGGGKRAALMLCDLCAAPLDRLLSRHGRASRAGVPDGRRATMEEIEALKQTERV